MGYIGIGNRKLEAAFPFWDAARMARMLSLVRVERRDAFIEGALRKSNEWGIGPNMANNESSWV